VLVEVLEHYLDSRMGRFPATARRHSPGRGLAAWPPAAPLFVGADGERISRGTLQYRVLRAFRPAGIDADRARGALVHGLRHTMRLLHAGVDVAVIALWLGHQNTSNTDVCLHADMTIKQTAIDRTRPAHVPAGTYTPPPNILTWLDSL
jgi:site-specific recombinase XerD